MTDYPQCDYEELKALTRKYNIPNLSQLPREVAYNSPFEYDNRGFDDTTVGRGYSLSIRVESSIVICDNLHPGSPIKLSSEDNDESTIPELPIEIVDHILRSIAKPTRNLFSVSKQVNELATRIFNPDVYALYRAIERRSVESVQKLLADPRVDPAAYCNYAILIASKNGGLEIVKLLLADSRIDPAVNNNTAIKLAAKNGHADIVKLLLADQRGALITISGSALRKASKNGHIKVVRLLLADPRVKPAHIATKRLDLLVNTVVLRL